MARGIRGGGSHRSLCQPPACLPRHQPPNRCPSAPASLTDQRSSRHGCPSWCCSWPARRTRPAHKGRACKAGGSGYLCGAVFACIHAGTSALAVDTLYCALPRKTVLPLQAQPFQLSFPRAPAAQRALEEEEEARHSPGSLLWRFSATHSCTGSLLLGEKSSITRPAAFTMPFVCRPVQQQRTGFCQLGRIGQQKQ